MSDGGVKATFHWAICGGLTPTRGNAVRIYIQHPTCSKEQSIWLIRYYPKRESELSASRN